MPAYAFGTLLGGILAGIVSKYLVMPVIPHYYDNLLHTYREDIQSKISLLDSLDRNQNYLPLAPPSFKLNAIHEDDKEDQ
jgi:hypothetical protein